MFKKILIANRGEIACRVIRTARRLKIKTVAVYSEADAGALHVALADEARPIGPSPAPESYLDGKAIIAAAKAAGAEAIHPGYGFLSENPAFATACAKAGLVFIGPDARTIAAMGDKSGAKELMAKAGVPLVPGYHGGKQDVPTLTHEALRIGFPLLIKAAAGGGGRGMRVVERASDLAAALAGAKREALAAFGDGRVLLEQYLRDPRHIEVQVFGDRHGQIVHLFARDCSAQRRHQKVAEESPPRLSPALARGLHAAALKAARAVGYHGAGTIEFIVARGRFYFIEANTRLQVKHPVTEMVTGLDLVEWQLRVAAGERLPRAQNAIRLKGHAIEARLYAEDPARDFMPSTGLLARLRFPPAGDDLRIETGLRQGDRVTEFYDPMIAKLVAWGKTRTAALKRLSGALAETRALGVVTNRDFLLRLLVHPDFARAMPNTGLIARNLKALGDSGPAPEAALAAAALSRIVGPARARGDAFSPWRLKDGWRSGGEGTQEFRFTDGSKLRRVTVHFGRASMALDCGGRRLPVMAWSLPEGDLAFDLGGEQFEASVAWRDGAALVGLANGTWRLDPAESVARAAGAGPAGRVVAPMPGKIAAVQVREGTVVKRGQILLVLEAMKMEHALAAPSDGVVAKLHCAAGDAVTEGKELLVLAGEKS